MVGDVRPGQETVWTTVGGSSAGSGEGGLGGDTLPHLFDWELLTFDPNSVGAQHPEYCELIITIVPV